MVKKYTWDEIKNLLKEELKKTKHILTFGTIGSLNVNNDIDVIITKKTTSKPSDFYKEIHNIFDSLNGYLMKKYNSRAIRFSSNKDESLTLSNYSKKDIAFHVMIYTSYNQIELDWSWYLLKKEKLKDVLIKTDYLIGSKKDFFSNKFKKRTNFDPLFIILYLGDRFNSNYSNKLFLQVTNSLFKTIFKHKLKLKTPIAKNKKEAKKIFYKLCDKLK